mmetsp:Transcript_29894/g.86926  ORF Transcript_29894/g.86926 Transcript_29894/m.86926 type:complete len:517 (+) Transcript_29894:176-1726(+)
MLPWTRFSSAALLLFSAPVAVALSLGAEPAFFADGECPIAETRSRLSEMWQQGLADGADWASKMGALLAQGDEQLWALCCRLGWYDPGSRSKQGGPVAALCWPAGASTDYATYARCCYKGLRHVVAAPAPDWMLLEIDSDLEPWRTQRVSRADLDRMQEEWGHVFCRFRVLRGGLVDTCDPASIENIGRGIGGERHQQHEAFARVARTLAAVGLLPEGLEFFVSPQIYDFAKTPAPFFTKARPAFAQGPVRVPTFELLSGFLDTHRATLHSVRWHEKVPKLYWRGGLRSFNACPCPATELHWPPVWQDFNLSRLLADRHLVPGTCADFPPSFCERLAARPPRCRCHRHRLNRTTFKLSNRVRLCELSRRFPNLIDAKLSYTPYQTVAEECRSRGYLAEFSKAADHSHFRYVMSTDGSTIDDTRFYWLLSTGSLMFKQITPLLPFGVPGLRPWEHFIPVREDFADLPSKIRWARLHDGKCQEMARRAKSFAETFFTEEQILRYVHLALMRYAELLDA